jgi:hypothetical protein
VDCSYSAVYESYQKYCNLIGAPTPNFEDWMRLREEPIRKPSITKEFLDSQGGQRFEAPSSGLNN